MSAHPGTPLASEWEAASLSEDQSSPRDDARTRRRFLAAAAGGAAGALALALGKPPGARAGHAVGDGNFLSTSGDPAIHAENTGGGSAIEAESIGQAIVARLIGDATTHTMQVEHDGGGGGAAIAAFHQGSGDGSALEAESSSTGKGHALFARRSGSGEGPAVSAERSGSGDGPAIGAEHLGTAGSAINAHKLSDGAGHAIEAERDGGGGGNAVRAFRVGDGVGHGARAVRDGTGAGNAFIAARRGTGSGAAIQAFAGVAETGELDHTGTGVRGVGSAIGVRAEGPIGLSVMGRAAFSTAGAGTVLAGANAAAVALPEVTTNSHISVTLASTPGKDNALAWVERNPGVGFTVRLIKKVGGSTPFTYLVVEPTT